MSVKNFIPTVWSTRMLAHLNANLVYGDVVNTEYEGEIKEFGDTIKINQIGPITISDYTSGGTLAAAEDLTSAQVTLTIDKAKSFNFKVDDIDAAQSNVPLLDAGIKRAGLSLQEVVDVSIATIVDEATIKVGSTSTPIALTADNIYDTIVDLAVTLDEAKVERAGRFIILPPFALGLLSKDPRFVKDYQVLVNGVVDGANVSGFEVRMSTNVPVTAKKYSILAGSDQAIAFAGQISKVEGYRPEGGFSDAIKGLYVYGVKAIQPKALIKMVASNGTIA